MDKINKYLKIIIKNDFLNNNDVTLLDFFKSKKIRFITIQNILKKHFNYSTFKILNIIYLSDKFIVEVSIILYNFSIYKFNSISDTYNFYLYIKNDTLNSNNYSLYFINSSFYFIIKNDSFSNIKILEFEPLQYSPFFISKIKECGLKIKL